MTLRAPTRPTRSRGRTAPKPRSLPASVLLQRTESLLAGSLNVLVLDDDDDMLAMLVSYLKLCPAFRITAVPAAEEARRRVHDSSWHCCLFDLYVPTVKHGLSLVEEAARRIPVVVLSGQSTGAEGYLCGRHGAVDFMDKGIIDAQPLIARVFELCLRKRLSRAFPFAEPADPRSETLEALFAGEVETVNQWADNLGVSTRSLEQRSHDACGAAPLAVLSLYRLYRIAQRHCLITTQQPLSLTSAERAVLGRFVANPALLRTN